MRLGIQQPNYIPWCGYFAKARTCDAFVFLDDAQTPGGQSYLYRTALNTRGKRLWLSVPTHRSTTGLIREITFVDKKWPKKHLMTLKTIYGRAPHFDAIYALLEPIYLDPGQYLTDFNIRVIRSIADYLDISCQFYRSTELNPEGVGDDRLVSLCKILGAGTYVSGQGGQNYQHPEKFTSVAIELEVRIYRPLKYGQAGEVFVGGLSIIDALFNIGRDTRKVLEYPDFQK